MPSQLTWSIAQGIRQGISCLSPKISGNELLNDGAAWIAGNDIFPEFRKKNRLKRFRKGVPSRTLLEHVIVNENRKDTGNLANNAGFKLKDNTIFKTAVGKRRMSVFFLFFKGFQ